MKIRKILPLILLAIASVVLLSSCDALLEAIFATNTIKVYVYAYIPTYGYYPGTDYVTVAVSGTASASGTAYSDGYDGLYMYWSLSIPKLPDGTYSVSVIYHHHQGINQNDWLLTYPTSFPVSSGNPHEANLSFNF